MSTGKCPGPDGFPVEFYKLFFDKLAPALIEMFNESYSKMKLPPTLNQASISLLLKKDKDALNCSSYRPISLLNVDFKLLSKTLALRLENILPKIISPDQTGFIKNRQSFFNLRRLFNTIYNLPTSKLPQAVISMDAEKAFDRVEWGYLFHTLERFGFGPNFVSWVKLLYSNPMASVRTNNNQSQYFRLNRSTRQGCPLSPLLFALAVEPLSIALRSNNQIKGISINSQEQKVSLYADDLLLYVTDFSGSIPVVLSLLNSFGAISGYRLNLNKSELLPLNRAALEYLLNTLKFRIANKQFKYLGVQVTKNHKDLFKANLSSLMAQVQNDLDCWSVLTLSLAARINSIKMNILPRFLYLFQSLPVFIPQSFFHKLDSIISNFIWNQKTPRLRKSFLQRPRKLGGMALPNFQLYYWASTIKIIQFWLCSHPEKNMPVWLMMEHSSCRSASLSALVHAPISLSFNSYSNNVNVKTVLKIWKQFRRRYGLTTLSTLGPITSNPIFTPSLIDGAFNTWSSKGIKTFKDLFIDNTFATFSQLENKFSIPKTSFFRYFQIRSFVIQTFPSFPSLPQDSSLDVFLKPTPMLKNMISYILAQIHSLQISSLNSIKVLWEEDLGLTLTDELWKAILDRVHHSSICARHAVIQCKIVHRAHLTKARLSKIFPNTDPTCERCHQADATLIHMFWECSKLFPYWTNIFDTISKVYKKNIEPNPVIALFGVTSQIPSLSSGEKSFIAFVSLLARRLILLKWKSVAPPTHVHWIKEVLYFSKLEKIRFSLKESQQKFSKIWGPFVEYIDSLDVSDTE